MAITSNVPSDNFEDLQRDVRDATKWVNGQEPFPNRAGEIIKPIPVIQQEWDQATTGQFVQQTQGLVAQAEAFASQAETAAEAAAATGRIYETSAAGQADTGLISGDYFWVVSATSATVLELWRKGGSAAVDTGKRTVSSKLEEYLLSGSGKNLINKATFRRGRRVSPASSSVIVDTAWICTDFIPVEPGKTYTVSGIESGMGVFYFGSASDNGYLSTAVGSGAYQTGYTFTVPSNQPVTHVVINVTNDGSAVTTYDNTAQLELGLSATAFEPFYKAIKQSSVEGLTHELSLKLSTKSLYRASEKNLIDKSAFIRGYLYSNANSGVVQNASGVCSGFIPVEEGQSYYVSGIQNGMAVGFLTEPSVGAGKGAGAVFFTAEADGGLVTVPTSLGVTHVVVNITTNGLATTQYDNSAQMESGVIKTAYEPFIPKIPKDDVAGLQDTLSFSDVIEKTSFNLINPAMIDFIGRYSTGTQSIIADTFGIAASDWIPVIEGEFYTISGNGVYGINQGAASPQGGFFSAYGQTTAVQNITWFAPVAGSGQVFQVPVGLGITHAIVSLRKAGDNPSALTLEGDAQLEIGELASTYVPFEEKNQIKRDLIPNSQSSSGQAVFNAELWYKFTEGEEGAYLMDKWPNFRKNWLNREKDLVVVNTGTSLTARTDEHCTDHPQRQFRPPLMHSNNVASILWDKIKWDGQEYRRYDSGYFSESGGAFITASNVAEWDDGPYRRGLTRYSENTGAGVSFQVPTGAWQFNFIYRTDSVATQQAQVSVSEGNGYMEVFDVSTASWIEANGYIFSMREPAPATRSVAVPDPSTGAVTNVTIATKGNSTYQKRLKMRCKSGAIDSRGSVKNVSISAAAAGRFLYWGVEWSKRQFMITYVNAARGSHNTNALSTLGLPRFADNEVWSFKPDLMFFELPIHNDGAASASAYNAGQWERLTNNFVFNQDYELSMITRAAFFGLSPEIGMFTSSVAYGFGGIDESGNLVLGQQNDGSMMTALDKFNQAYSWVKEHHPEVVIVNSAKRWVDAGVAIFGDLKSATIGSGKSGVTFTNEGSHWNDTGSKVIAKTLTGIFDLTK